MEEITFGDVLLHYSQKLKEVYEDVEDTRKMLTDSKAIVEAGWKGQAADNCTIKLEEISLDYSKVSQELSDIITKLSALITEFDENGDMLNESDIIS